MIVQNLRVGRLAAPWMALLALAACSGGSGDQVAATTDAGNFSPVTPTPMLAVPADGAEGVSRNATLEWPALEGADAYQVLLGTSPGASDLLVSSALTSTSFVAERLPPAQQIFVQLGARVGGQWSYSQSSFVTRKTSLLVGVPQTSNSLDVSQPLMWESIEGAQAYYLYVGSAPGGKDLLESGSTTATSYPIVSLHGGRRSYGRLHTLIDGRWLFEDYVFDVPPIARLLTPRSNLSEVDTEGLTATWSIVDNAAAYRLMIGSENGFADVWDSGEVDTTGARVPPSLTGFAWHVRLGTLFEGQWQYSDAQIFAMPMPQLIAPLNGATDMDVAHGFEWSAVKDPVEYSLRVGTAFGASDLANVASTQATQVQVPNLPSGVPLYVRVGARTALGWRYRDHTVQVGGARADPTIVYPTLAPLDAARPFEWLHDPLVQSYQLQIGSTQGANDLHDSGSISVGRRFVPGLPVNQPLFGRVTATYRDGATRATDFTFVVGQPNIDAVAYFAEAKHATAQVRAASGIDNVPQANTLLAKVRVAESKPFVNCVSYATTLRARMVESNVALDTRQLSVCLNPNTFDCHALVEARDPQSGAKVLLDPTFGLSPQSAATSAPLTIEELSAAARASAWQDIQYEFLTPAGDLYGQSYYMDYPLLFVNVYTLDQTSFLEEAPASILNYYEYVGGGVTHEKGAYALQCAPAASSVRVLLDGAERTLACTSSDRLTYIFLAFDIAAPDGEPQLNVYRPLRFMFVDGP
jgi:hypothetical protein